MQFATLQANEQSRVSLSFVVLSFRCAASKSSRRSYFQAFFRLFSFLGISLNRVHSFEVLFFRHFFRHFYSCAIFTICFYLVRSDNFHSWKFCFSFFFRVAPACEPSKIFLRTLLEGIIPAGCSARAYFRHAAAALALTSDSC